MVRIAFKRKLIVTFLLVVLCETAGHAQNPPQPGVVPFSTNSFGVDLASSTVNIAIPLRTKVGKIPFQAWLVGTSGETVITPAPLKWQPMLFTDTGLTYQDPTSLVFTYTLTNANTSCPGGGTTTTVNAKSVLDHTGAAHLFSGLSWKVGTGTSCLTGGTAVAYDNSGFTIVANGQNITISDKSGNWVGGFCTPTTGCSIQGPGQTLHDPDGATIADVIGSQVTVTDTLNTTALTSASGSYPSRTYSYTDATPTSHSQNFTTGYTSLNLATAFHCSSISDFSYPPQGGSAWPMITSVTTPDGNYTIAYEPTPGMTGYYTGRIAKITAPTGASVSYSYTDTQGHNGINCNSWKVPTIQVTVNDGNGGINTWKFVNSDNIGGGNFNVTETDPAGNTIVYSFFNEFATQRLVKDANSNVLSNVVMCYNQHYSSQSSCITPSSPNLPTLPFLQIDIYSYINGSSSPSLVETKFDTYGNTTEVKQYDFGATFPPSGTPLSDTTSSYGSWNGSTCTAFTNFIRDRLCVQTTTDSTGTLAQSRYSYNSTGHPTQVSRLVGGSTFLTSSYTYNPNGTLATATDVNNVTTTYMYNGSGGCNNLLPTSVTFPAANGIQLSTATMWSCNGGVPTQYTDENAHTTSYSYIVPNTGYGEPFWRVTQYTDPTGNVTNLTYTTTTKEGALTFNGGASAVDVITTFDGLGRPIFKQTRQTPGSSNYDSVQYGYGFTSNLGPFTTVSVPYSGTFQQPAPVGIGITKTQSDGLGRPTLITDGGQGTVSYSYIANTALQTVGPAPAGENAKSKQFQVDGLGRLSSICEITGTTNGGGNCAQSNPKTGYYTKYTYDGLGNLKTVVQNAQGTPQSRSYSHDGLSRLTSETNPENGTMSFTYDSDSSCGTSKGDLVKRVDAMGNVTCYAYDALHRNTSVTYPSGPYAASTPSKSFVYDASSFSCTQWPSANLKGRLAEAYTGPSSAKITDEAFCYTPRGEMSDFYESTPNSGGFYHIPMTYWANGLMHTIGPYLTTEQAGYMPDGEGRAASAYHVHAGMQAFDVPTITYNAASQPTQLMVSCGGTTCYPFNYTYDPSTLRMTQYSAALNGGTVSGTLTWNPNGSLKTLTLANPFNAAEAQTCNYTADDLSRLASVNCGSAWAQTFTYDPFGNITKSGSLTWAPGYNASTNRYTLGGTSYDANGNLLNDSFLAYTWDAEGKNLSTNYGSQLWTFVNDAFGHMVEFDNTGAYRNSFVQLGRNQLWMIGQTAYYLEFPLPGGSKLTSGAGAHGVQFADWLGSIRALVTYTGGGWADGGVKAPFGETYASQGPPLAFASIGGTGWGNGGDGNLANTTYWATERRYRANQGRWLTPDPAGVAAVDASNPQSWNRYSYVQNSPLSQTDPRGLCDVVVAGITMSPTSPESAALIAFANSIGAMVVFPYNGGDIQSGVGSVAMGNAEPPWNVKPVSVALNQAAQDPGPVNVYTFSGGAQAFNSALQRVSPDVQGRINNVTYLDPGAVSDLAGGTGSTTVISNPAGIIDPLIFYGSIGDANPMETDCKHDANCVFPQQQHFLLKQAGSRCIDPSTFSNINPRIPGLWDPLQLWDFIVEVQSVSHQIIVSGPKFLPPL
jgi:RHS repeat-associated protein